MSPQKEYGDFQTPLSLARQVSKLIKHEESQIRTIIEPTCGIGAFLQAIAEDFGKSPNYWGFDLNPEYAVAANSALTKLGSFKATIQQRDFYTINWREFLSNQAKPILIVGNPPWITNAGMGVIGGKNLPIKSNFQGHNGFDARTGKANFDISEWMVIKLLEALQGTRAVIAMLCKTATARKVLRHAWLNRLDAGPSSLHLIDAQTHFGVSVDACLLYTHTGIGTTESTATIYRTLSFDEPLNTFGLFGGDLVSDIDSYRKLRSLDGIEYRKWRSGVKHDAAQVMEFTRDGHSFINGLEERYNLEEDYMFPLLKSSDLANGRLQPSRYVLLTQRRVSDPTDDIQRKAPKTWIYLSDHANQLDKRGSSIYKDRPRFSIFGVGDYSFAPAKVAISGLYKNLHFRAIAHAAGKPIMVDDTCNFIPCNSIEEANFFADLLNTPTAQRFFSSIVFSDAKRPVTIDVLKRIDLKKLAEHAKQENRAIEYLSSPSPESPHQRLLVFEKKSAYRTKKSNVRRKPRKHATVSR